MQADGSRHNCSKSAIGAAVLLAVFWAAVAVHAPDGNAQPPQQQDDGYRGIWFTLGQVSEYGDKYSGGLGTYTAKHVPLAVYSEKAEKTFFVYGGAKEGKRHLLAMASYYDHRRGVVPRPTIVHDKGGVNDPHDNPSIALDEHGYVWVFVSGRGRHRPGFKYRSVEPLSVDRFELVSEEEMTYPQPWWIDGKGFLYLFTKYTGVRELYWNTSPDGRQWTPHQKLAGMGGHYQVSNRRGNRVVTAFNMHPGGQADKRTNLYFVQSDDLGHTWRTADGTPVDTPMTDPHCPALVRDFQAEGRLVYMKDVNFDSQGNPVILVVTAAHHQPGPSGDPRIWTIVHWDGRRWQFHEVTRSTGNYDMGSLYVEGDTWRIIGPTEPGPQRHGTGGEMAVWTSSDQGKTWIKERDVTAASRFNHAYARRPVDAHPDFYAFWADGNPDELSPSHLYFTNRDGDRVWRLPYDMTGDFAKPERVRMGGDEEQGKSDEGPGTARDEGFVRLFDGNDLNAWKTSPAAHWVVDRGVITLKDRDDGQLNNPDYLWTKETYADFILELEFKVPDGYANSGVFLRTSDLGDPVYTGIEVQVSNSYGKPVNRGGTAGAIYDCLAPTKNASKKPGEWNQYRITCRDNVIDVALNGQQVLQMDLDRWTEPEKNPDGTPNKYPRSLKDFAREGHIGLQDHGRPVWYRNIRVKRLP
ncbi:MAG TPA: family 16 glycoside hydrolase [Thermoguttaceae bacterium]|nr:family 16 glycoside hydrolase [Thermoguttaceae bacterium]